MNEWRVSSFRVEGGRGEPFISLTRPRYRPTYRVVIEVDVSSEDGAPPAVNMEKLEQYLNGQ